MIGRVPAARHRYSILLALILATVAFQLAAPEREWAQLVAVLLQAATLLMAVVTSESHAWVIRGTIAAVAVLVAGAVLALFGTDQVENEAARVIAVLLVALAPPAIVLGLLKHFRAEGVITRQTMFGVLCIYLLLGLLFSASFSALQALSDDAFFTATRGVTSDFLYFSFSTLTTTGYGDLVAATNAGRSLAITEALIGQIYLVTVVALIVGNVGAAAPRGNR
jgi:hypothetical protein